MTNVGDDAEHLFLSFFFNGSDDECVENDFLHRIPSKQSDYSLPSYWKNRYANEVNSIYDWYEFSHEYFFETFLQPLCGQPHLFLEIGCGNSDWATKIQNNCFHVVSSDIDYGVLINMRKNIFLQKGIESLSLDCCSLAFRSELFDIVFDKGTIDALFCEKNLVKNQIKSEKDLIKARIKSEKDLNFLPTNLHGGEPRAAKLDPNFDSENLGADQDESWNQNVLKVGNFTKIAKSARSVHRVLVTGGTWFIISSKHPHDVLRLMQYMDELEVEVDGKEKDMDRQWGKTEENIFFKFSIHPSYSNVNVIKLFKL